MYRTNLTVFLESILIVTSGVTWSPEDAFRNSDQNVFYNFWCTFDNKKTNFFSFFFLWKIFETFLSLRTVTHAGKFRPKMCFIRHHKKSPTGCHYYILLSCLIKIMPQYVAQFEIQFRRTFWTTLDANLCEGVGVFILIQWEPQGCLIFSK